MIETILIGAGSAVVLAPFKYYLGFLCKKVHQAKVRRLPKPDYDAIQALEEAELGQVYTKKPKTEKILPNGARVVTKQGKRRVVVNTYPGSWARYTAKVEKKSEYGWGDNDGSYREHMCSFQSRWESQAIRRAVRDMQRHERFSARMKSMSSSPSGDCTMRF